MENPAAGNYNGMAVDLKSLVLGNVLFPFLKSLKQDKMAKRFVAIWFRHLLTDWFTRCRPGLKEVPFVIATPEHGRMMVKAVNPIAFASGIYTGMMVADGRAILPE